MVLGCSFCGKDKDQVAKLVAGPGVYICNECVDLSAQIIAQELERRAEPAGDRELLIAEQMSDEEILALLPKVASVSAQVDDSLQTWVGRLRDRGVSWARIGAALGVTRQSAWERFSGEE